jgi:hypothetical protein
MDRLNIQTQTYKNISKLNGNNTYIDILNGNTHTIHIHKQTKREYTTIHIHRLNGKNTDIHIH